MTTYRVTLTTADLSDKDVLAKILTEVETTCLVEVEGNVATIEADSRYKPYSLAEIENALEASVLVSDYEQV